MAPRPRLVYDRIDENRRRTVWLLGLFGLILLPFFLALSLPLGYLALFPAAVTGATDQGTFFGIWTVWLAGGLGAAVGGAVAATLVELRRAASWALRRVGARPVSRSEEPELHRAVENLSIGAGLPAPAVHVTETGPPNAFAVGTEPERSALVVTRRLLDLLDRRELQAVVAHELSHVGNEDVRLNTVLAALVATLRFPYRLLEGIDTRLATGCLWLSVLGFAMACLGFLTAVAIVVYVLASPDMLERVRAGFAEQSELGLALAVEFALHLAWAAPAYLLIGGRSLGLAVGRAVAREREFLADADAVLLTRDPEGLATALVKIEAGREGGSAPPIAMAHLYIVDPLAERPASWREKLVSAHPPVEERIEALRSLGPVSPEALEEAWREAAEAMERWLVAAGTGRGSGDATQSPDGTRASP